MKGTRLPAAAGLGYLLGTVPSADVACRVASGGSTDLRAVGSRNPGANNVVKHMGRRWGYGVMAADIAKGAAACVAGRTVAGTNGAHVAGVAAVVGHCYPPWSGFRGGKGVATSVGQCVATFPVWSVVDLLVAWVAAEAPRRRWYGDVDDTRWWRRRHVGATVVSSSAWVAASTLWWRRGWPNLWGPRPTVALPLAAAATSAVILLRFATEPPPLTEGPPDQGPPPDGGDREPLVPVPALPTLAAEASPS